MQLIELFCYVSLGICAGTMSGLLGIGGNIIILPSLLFIYKMHNFATPIALKMASGTALSISIITVFFSLRAHLKLGTEIWSTLRIMIPGLIVGTICGALLAYFLHTAVLRTILGILLSLIALRILFGFNPKPDRTLPNNFGLRATSFAISTISGMLGLAGGSITTSFLLWCNTEIRRAIALSLGCGFIISIVGAISFMFTGHNSSNLLPPHSIGYVYLPAFLAIAATTPIFTTLGAKLSHLLPTKTLKRIFGLLLLIISIKMMWI